MGAGLIGAAPKGEKQMFRDAIEEVVGAKANSLWIPKE
jgi:hypothetical protein